MDDVRDGMVSIHVQVQPPARGSSRSLSDLLSCICVIGNMSFVDNPGNTRHWFNVVSRLCQFLRR